MRKIAAGGLSLALLTVAASSAMAEENDYVCPNNFEKNIVSGSVNTNNVGQTVQVGTISLTLVTVSGETRFDRSGAIIGRITGQDGMGGATLEHNIVFGDGSRIDTSGDSATLIPADPYFCSFNVTETIQNIWGTGVFKRATGEITATGTVSFCEGANGNQFELSGTVCLAPGRY